MNWFSHQYHYLCFMFQSWSNFTLVFVGTISGYSNVLYNIFLWAIGSSRKSIQVLGPLNSGTNLMYKMLQWVDQDVHRGGSECNFCYKHMDVDCLNWDGGAAAQLFYYPYIFFEKLTQSENHLFIFMYRPIMPYLKSCVKTPYWSNYKDVSTPITSASQPFKTVLPVEQYESHYQFYEMIDAKVNANRCAWVNYELLIDPDNGYDYISSKLEPFGVTISKENFAKVMNRKGKSHGHSVKNSREAYERLKSQKFPEEDIAAVKKMAGEGIFTKYEERCRATQRVV